MSGKQKLPSLEELVHLLASFCDGAKRRDGHGFNKGDSQDGRRLSAIARAKVPWTDEDHERACSLVRRYAKQAAHGYHVGDPRAAMRLMRAIREDKIASANDTTDKAVYNYLSLSPGGTKAYFCLLDWTPHYRDVARDVYSLRGLRHGSRRISVDNKKVLMAFNGKRRRIERWEVTFNGTTQKRIIDIARRWDFVVDPAAEASLDQKLDIVLGYPKSAYLFTGVREKKKGIWAVFDLDKADAVFTRTIKKHLPKNYKCEPSDDWNWFVPLNKDTHPWIKYLVHKFGFKVADDLTTALAANPSDPEFDRTPQLEMKFIDPE